MYICGGVIPELTGRRVRLRAMAAGDAGALFEIWCHPQVAPWLDAPFLSSAEEAGALIALLAQMAREEESIRWSILGPEAEVIGSCGYNHWQLEGAYRGRSVSSCHLPPWVRGICGKRWSLCWNSASAAWG